MALTDLDPDLLAQATEAGGRLHEAERQALLARADYHATVRRLHLCGGSLRDIAATLSISHQRVQQIVRGAGGTWWSRAWRGRRAQTDAVCTWCDRPPRDVRRLIAGPHVYICDACVETAEERLSARDRRPGPFQQVKTKAPGYRCDFCAKRATLDRPLVIGTAGAICSACLGVCHDIIASSDRTA